MNEVLNIQDKIKQIQTQGGNWLEPMRDFIFLVKKAKKTTLSGDPIVMKTFLKNIGSNFILKGRKFEFLAKKEFVALRAARQRLSLWTGRDSNSQPPQCD